MIDRVYFTLSAWGERLYCYTDGEFYVSYQSNGIKWTSTDDVVFYTAGGQNGQLSKNILDSLIEKGHHNHSGGVREYVLISEEEYLLGSIQ